MNFEEMIGRAAGKALVSEVKATPKPGLVDSENNGSHSDMNIDTFLSSAKVLEKYFAFFASYGRMTSAMPAKAAFADARKIGVEAERAMYEATGGINTHKGAIFSLGLLSLSAGRLHEKGREINLASLCDTVAEFTEGICERDYARVGGMFSHGDEVYKKYGLTGPRGEAEKGFPTLRFVTYPVLSKLFGEGYSENDALVRSLLKTMAVLDDTNILNRSDRKTLEYVKSRAASLVYSDLEEIREFDRELIGKNVSPGGSADLISQAYFVYLLEKNAENGIM